MKAQILRNNKNITVEKATEIATSIVKYSEIYEVNPRLMAAIFMQESSYNVAAINRKCGYDLRMPAWHDTQTCIAQDIGISQINFKTIEAYRFSPKRLHEDLDYSIRAGFVVMAWFKDKFKHKEPSTWFCRYNTGTAKMEKIQKNCQIYVNHVNRWM